VLCIRKSLENKIFKKAWLMSGLFILVDYHGKFLQNLK